MICYITKQIHDQKGIKKKNPNLPTHFSDETTNRNRQTVGQLIYFTEKRERQKIKKKSTNYSHGKLLATL